MPSTFEKRPTASTEEEASSEYESEVTKRFFEEKWGAVAIEANPEIKERMKENITQMERRNKHLYEEVAEELLISVEELKEMLQVWIEETIKESDFFMAISAESLKKVTEGDNRFKSVFETDNRESNKYIRSSRVEHEEGLFGFNSHLKHVVKECEELEEKMGPLERYIRPRSETLRKLEELEKKLLETNKEKRPVYGYFSDEANGIINGKGTVPPPNSVRMYGGVTIKMKRDTALQKCTITTGDSYSDAMIPTPAACPHFTSIKNFAYFADEMLIHSAKNRMFLGYNYTEVQYHDGLSVDDIESIHVSAGNDLSQEEIKEVEEIVARHNKQHPDSPIPVVAY